MNVEFSFSSDNSAATPVIANLPALTGSEKQVAWAEDIRSQFVRDFVETHDKEILKRPLLIKSDEGCGEWVAYLDSINGLLSKKGGMIAKAFATTDAKFWIENRSAGLLGMVRAAQ